MENPDKRSALNELKQENILRSPEEHVRKVQIKEFLVFFELSLFTLV